MPANLNALIRYKTINSCLYGGRRRKINELINVCSDALIEIRGRDELVSERTVRDDLRVIRSDILGFNAPIVQAKGYYFYSDPSYSIMTVSITDSGLLDQIISFLQSIKAEMNHPELESILDRLKKVTIREHPSETVKKLKTDLKTMPSRRIRMPVKSKSKKAVKKTIQEIDTELKTSLPIQFDSFIQYSLLLPKVTTWGDIFKIIL
jgi:hypothetical protein